MALASASLAAFAVLVISTSPLAVAHDSSSSIGWGEGSRESGPSPRADAGEANPGPSKSPTPTSEDPREIAKQAFDEGLAAVANGEFALAVTSFERAYGLRPHPVTLFNLALALEKAERLPEAWELYDYIVDTAVSNAERREIRRHMRTIEAQIAIVEIDADPRQRLCIDGLDMPKGEISDYRLAIEPGPHDMLLDEHAFTVEFEAGDRRVLLLDRADSLVASQRGSVLMPAMAGTAIGTGALALGLGIGAAAANDDRTQTGLAVSAATSAGLAVAASVVVLLLETRVIQDPARSDPAGTDRASGSTCPGSPKLERRLDLRLGPKLGQPAKFATAPALRAHPMPMMLMTPGIWTGIWAAASTRGSSHPGEGGFPHPHAIQPPRNSADPN